MKTPALVCAVIDIAEEVARGHRRPDGIELDLHASQVGLNHDAGELCPGGSRHGERAEHQSSREPAADTVHSQMLTR